MAIRTTLTTAFRSPWNRCEAVSGCSWSSWTPYSRCREQAAIELARIMKDDTVPSKGRARAADVLASLGKAVKNGEHTGARPGRALWGPGRVTP